VSLRYALLALLTVEPMTGYDLSKQFQSSVSHVWHAPDSQIYPELKRMQKAGLLDSHEVPWGPRGKKREYQVTDAGIQTFKLWMNQTLSYPPERDPMHLKAAYFEWAEPDSARAQLNAHISNYRERRADWAEKVAEIVEGRSVILGKRLANADTGEHDRIWSFKKFTYDGLIARAEQEIAWAESGLVLLHQLEITTPASPS
jgi:PadR family transcriptional regulator AphA